MKPTKNNQISYIDAINLALHDSMNADDTIFIYGQDVAKFGGAFKATKGLFDKYPKRIFDSPISEDAMVGLSVGASIEGVKPIIEMQFSDFASVGYSQVINQAGTLYYRTNVPCQIVIRLPVGGTPGGGPFHCQSPETIYAHYPGLIIVAPSTPEDAYNMLIESIKIKDPVIFCENKYIYQRSKQDLNTFKKNTKKIKNQLLSKSKNYLDQNNEIHHIGKAQIIKTGTHATIVTYGSMIQETLKAQEILKTNYDYDLEIIDLRTIKPLDIDTILLSLARTGRLMCVSESFPWGGTNSEIIKKVVKKGFHLLDAPPFYLNAKDTPIPFHPNLWNAHRPNAEKIAKEIFKLLEY